MFINQNLKEQKYGLIIAFAVHLLVIILVFCKFNNATTPVLSFSISASELAVNPGNISITSIATSKNNNPKSEPQIKPNNSANNSDKTKSTESSQANLKGKTDNPIDSKQQSAVFSDQTPAIFDAAYLQNPSPLYPALSRRLKEQGKVLLEVYVSESGKVEKINVKKSSGFTRLDDAALNTVKNWRFVAAKKDQQLVSSWVQVPINFILE